MKKFLSLLISVLLLVSILTLFPDAMGNYPSHEVYVLSAEKPILSEPDEDGLYTVFGVKCIDIVFIEIVSGEIQNNGRYFFRLNLPKDAYDGEAAETLKKDPAVITAWAQKGEITADGREYIADMALVYYTGEVPTLVNPDENGCFEIFGVKCLGVKYDLFVQTGKAREDYHRITLYLPEGSDENKVIEKLFENENVTSAALNEFIIGASLSSASIGDVNGDGNINSKDYVLVKRGVLGTYSLTSNEKRTADINGNGKIDAKDYLLIKRACLGSFEIK